MADDRFIELSASHIVFRYVLKTGFNVIERGFDVPNFCHDHRKSCIRRFTCHRTHGVSPSLGGASKLIKAARSSGVRAASAWAAVSTGSGTGSYGSGGTCQFSWTAHRVPHRPPATSLHYTTLTRL